LKIPPKDMLPDYRKERSHDDFVTSLKNVFGSGVDEDHFLDSVLEVVKSDNFKNSSGLKDIEYVELSNVRKYIADKEYRKSTEIVDLNPYLHL
jgi:hypothetical protein